MAKAKVDTNVVLIVGGIVVAYFGILRPIFKKTGLIQSQEGKENDLAETKFEGWNPKYWKQISDKKIKATFIKAAGAELLAKQINDAWRFLNDDEDEVYAAFRQLKTQVQLSQVSYYFSLLYNKDLYNFLKDLLSDAEFNNVVKIINTYKKY